MVWYGMVRYGMTWHGMVWHGMVWHGMERCRCYSMVSYVMVMSTIATTVVWYGMIRYDMVRFIGNPRAKPLTGPWICEIPADGGLPRANQTTRYVTWGSMGPMCLPTHCMGGLH